jgi:hypothetical protein
MKENESRKCFSVLFVFVLFSSPPPPPNAKLEPFHAKFENLKGNLYTRNPYVYYGRSLSGSSNIQWELVNAYSRRFRGGNKNKNKTR